jgi:TetR/AcrR family transcriptional regulator, tetracycline repressor protein
VNSVERKRPPRRGRPRRGEGSELTLDKIVAVALRIAGEQGLAALNMRRLGAALKVDPMAVYYHVPSKEALLHLLVDKVFSRMDLNIDAGAPWRARVESWARAYRELIRSHPSLVLHITSHAAASSSAMPSVSEPLYVALGDAGLSDPLIAATADTLVDFLNGYGLGLTGSTQSSGSGLVEFPKSASRTSVLKRVFETTLNHKSMDESFSIGLEMVLEGALALQQAGRWPR